MTSGPQELQNEAQDRLSELYELRRQIENSLIVSEALRRQDASVRRATLQIISAEDNRRKDLERQLSALAAEIEARFGESVQHLVA